MKKKIEISSYMKGVIFRTYELLLENRKKQELIERYLKDLEEIQFDLDNQVTKWFQGSEKEIIFRIFDYLDKIFDDIISIENPLVFQYALTELYISTSLKKKIEKKRISSNEEQAKELLQLSEFLEKLYYANFTQSEGYCQKKVVRKITLNELLCINPLEIERVDNFKHIEVYFKSSCNYDKIIKLKKKFKEDYCSSIANWYGAIEVGYYYVLIK